MPAPESIRQLVERFEQHRDAYRAGKYNETQLRREFLDPFFEALGWDVFNRLGYSEENKHVIHEDSLEIEGAKKAPDYAFKIGKERKFFVEAKKPSVRIETNPEVAFQLKRYVWSAKLPLGILTDFEEFAIYECRSKPKVSDSVKTGRVMLLNYTEYIERWDDIVSIFSHDAVMTGKFDKFANSAAKKKGTAEVDSAFLAEIEGWREALAKNVALRNKLRVKSEADLNFAVQMTIDRMIFLRICEDRGYESEYQLQGIANPPPPSLRDTSPKYDGRASSDLGEEGRVYAELKKLFERADRRYNSGLFHFKDEKGRGRADTFTTGLEIDDKVLKDIIKDLYYPAPYVFALIPADILGQIYEQFLGKVIRLTASGNAKVEEKPEVRKAGGVYYTPTFIVYTIIVNTLGKLLLGLTPKEAARLRIVDPACGSGTFLLGAYQYLLDWHLNWYLNNDFEKWSKGKNAVLVQSKEGWKLSVEKKKEILLNNIYGVDIDPQAVEVTKLSLLLKVIEDPGQLSYLDERILPDLGRNIQCGNSLIGPDYWDGQLMVDEEEHARVNAFDWKAAFPEVFAQGGFDVVVGNPPYIRIQAMREWASEQVEYYAKKYTAASKGNYDIYVVFVEKALSLLNAKGKLGFILPHKFFNAQYGESLRGVIANGKHLSKVVHFGDQQVFANATTYTCLMFLDKSGHDEFEFEKVQDLDAWRAQTSEVLKTSEVSGMINASRVTESEWNFSVGKNAGLFEKLSEFSPKLGEVADIFVGLQTSADDVFIMDLIEEKQNSIRLKSKALNTEWVFEKDLLFPIVSGTDVIRYQDLPERQYVLFPYEIRDDKASLLDIAYIQKEYPKTANYLLENKKQLEDREKGKMKGSRWHGYIYLKNMTRQSIQKLCVPRLVDRLYATYDVQAIHFLDNVDVGGLTLKVGFEEQGLLYLLGLLNSKLLRWYFPSISAPFRGGWLSANRQFLSQLPIRPINFSDSAEKAQHDKMVSLVERMLALHKSLKSTHNPQEADRLTREVESVDKSIDGLVYELYGLTEEEIKIVEGR